MKAACLKYEEKSKIRYLWIKKKSINEMKSSQDEKRRTEGKIKLP